MEQIKVDQNAQNIAQLAAAIAQLQRTTDFILKQLKLEYTDDPASSIPPQLAEKMSALLRQGKKGELEAIKEYRSHCGHRRHEEAHAARVMPRVDSPAQA